MFDQYCCLISTAQADEKLADKCTLCYAALDHGGTDLDRICIHYVCITYTLRNGE